MGEVIYEKKFKYKGPMDVKQVYKTIKDYLDSKGYDVIEKKHEEEVKEDGSRSISIELEAEKEPIEDYVKYKMSIEISFDNVKKAVVDGKEMDDGEFEIKVKSEMETSEKVFGEGPLNKFWKALFEKYLIGSEYKQWKKQGSKEADGLIQEIKKILGTRI